MKKGISLIVLVITIIVMIIIAGAIIISLNNSNVIKQSNDAVYKSDMANANSLLSIAYAERLAAHYSANPTENYEANTADLALIDAAVKAGTNNDWGVVLTTDKTGYEVKYLHVVSGNSGTGTGTAQ